METIGSVYELGFRAEGWVVVAPKLYTKLLPRANP